MEKIENIKIEVTKCDGELKLLELPPFNPDDYFPHDPSLYIGKGGTNFKPSVNQVWTSVPVMEFLKGKPWDNVALAYVSGLRPSYIRVSTGMLFLDSRVNRVTVIVDDNNIIKNISQEMCLSVPETIANGSALDAALKYGEQSEQCQWYNDDKIRYFSHGEDGFFKCYFDGTRVKYPDEK